ncbi:flagellar hook-associated protein FlgL [soil metagenome]
MRITDHHIVDMAAAAATRNESRVGELAQQVSSGLRVSKPSDDPSAWLSAQRARVRSALNDGTSQAIQVGHERLIASDGALATLSGLVSQAREISVQGANGTQTSESRAALGAEMESLFQTAVATANTVDASGEYLLAGTNSLAKPFDSTTGVYTGDATTRGVNMDTVSTQVATVAGASLTSVAPNGVEIMPLLKQLADALNANDQPTIQTLVGSMEQAVKQLAQLRGQTGGHMAVLESAKTAHDELSTRIATSISNSVEIDTVAAASELAKASQALTVSHTVTSHVLTLLDPSK